MQITAGRFGGMAWFTVSSWIFAAKLSAASGTFVAQPQHLVFNTIAGQAGPTVQRLRLFARGDGASVNWSLVSKPAWLAASAVAGPVPGTVDVSVSAAGLSAGVYDANLVLAATGLANSPTTTAISLIVNPNARAQVARWRDGRKGALSVSVDDTLPTGLETFERDGFRGSYFCNGTQLPAFVSTLRDLGMELGSHLVYHICCPMDEAKLRQNIEASLTALAALQSTDDTLVLAWPCGDYNTLPEQGVAAEYFLAARGYDINQLEDPTPADWMNVKSFNSHEHAPFPPTDLKTVVDSAEASGKWANLVFHAQLNDDGALDYATTKSLWVAPVGTVLKYILQRDRVILSGYDETGGTIRFDLRRLALDAAVKRGFESAVRPDDAITLQLDVTGWTGVESVTVDGAALPYQMRADAGRKLLFVTLPVTTKNQRIVATAAGSARPALAAFPAQLRFSTQQGSDPTPQTVQISDTAGSGTMAWTASVVRGGAWLRVDCNAGVGSKGLSVTTATVGLAEGLYQGALQLTAPGAANSPQTVEVALGISAVGAVRYDFKYPDKASFLQAGWDLLARKADGTTRNTESSLGLSFDQTAHPGVLRLVPDSGDLWGSINNSRNTLFRSLPSNWASIRAQFSFMPAVPWEQVGLFAYQDDDNYVSMCRSFGVYGDEIGQDSTAQRTYFLNNRVALDHERQGAPAIEPSQPFPATSFFMRLDRDPATESISGFYSLDGWRWLPAGSVVQRLTNPRLALFVGGSPPSALSKPNVDIARVEVVQAVPVRTLQVASSQPDSGVPITVSPADNNANTGGATPFSRSYFDGATVVLTAPAWANGSPFAKWQTNGVDCATSPTVTIKVAASMTATAVYVPSGGGMNNGSFEAGTSGWILTGNLGVTQSSSTSDGQKCIAFNWGQTAPNGVLSQSSATVRGQTYALSFDYGARGDPRNEQRMRVTVQGATVLLSQNLSAWSKSNWDICWVSQTYVFVADSAVTTIVFQDTSTVTDNTDLLLDNVRISSSTQGLRTVSITSINPTAGVSIGVSPGDNTSEKNGCTPFSRTYVSGTSVTVTAPAAVNGNIFQKWQINGADSGANPSQSLTLTANTTVTACYVPFAGIVNGSFELGSTGWTLTGNLGVSYSSTASDGQKFLAFNWGQTAPNGLAAQSFETVPGRSYTLSFDYGVRGGYSWNEQRLRMTIRGGTVLATQTMSIFGSGLAASRWLPQSYGFVANSVMTTVTFEDVSPMTENLDLTLDNVRVVPANGVAVASVRGAGLNPAKQIAAEPTLTITLVDGLCRLTLGGAHVDSYRLETSEDLTHWHEIDGAELTRPGLIELEVGEGRGPGTGRFFRILQLNQRQ